MVPAEEDPKASPRLPIPLGAADAIEIDRWAETPVTFTNSR
jgi:hypothetical protein